MKIERCPVCGKDCVKDAEILIKEASTRFSSCPACISVPLDKRLPPPGISPADPCPGCGKRFIDDVFSHCHSIMAEEGVIGEDTPLGGIGMPLISPGIWMNSPPFLPERSLILQTRHADCKTAGRLVAEVPEIKGVILDTGQVPGLRNDDLSSSSVNRLLAGCDVRADIFRSDAGSFAVYKQQSLLHIEFPGCCGPKIMSVEAAVREKKPEVFIDACSGAGTLGIAALLSGVPEVVFNDAWYPAAFWSAVNLHANRNISGTGDVRLRSLPGEERSRVAQGPVKIAETQADGRQAVVLWGDYMNLGESLPEGRRLAALDLFGKKDRINVEATLSRWKSAFGGDAFIP